MSQPVETQVKRRDYSSVAGTIIIVSACLLIVSNLISILNLISIYNSSYVSLNSNIFRGLFWSELPSFAVYMVLDVVVLYGGVQARAKRRFVFAVFSSSVLITISLTGTASLFALLTRTLTASVTISLNEVPFIIISLVGLVLSVMSLIFLEKSRHEFI